MKLAKEMDAIATFGGAQISLYRLKPVNPIHYICIKCTKRTLVLRFDSGAAAAERVTEVVVVATKRQKYHWH